MLREVKNACLLLLHARVNTNSVSAQESETRHAGT